MEPPVVLGLGDPYELPAEERIELVELIEGARSRLDAAQVRVVESVAASYEARGMTASEARHEVGAALRLSPVTAADRVQVAVDLVRRLPRTLALLEDGAIAYLSAAYLARGVDDLCDGPSKRSGSGGSSGSRTGTPAWTRCASMSSST